MMRSGREMVDTQVPWIGHIPRGWKVRPFKNFLTERTERSEFGGETLLSVSAYTGVSPKADNVGDGDHLSRAESLEGYRICHSGDLVMNIMLAWNGAQAVSEHNGIVSPAYAVFQCDETMHRRYLHYLVKSEGYLSYFKAHSRGVIESRLRLYPEKLGSLISISPPLSEQETIASYLDHHTSLIDRERDLIAKKITLLREKRKALIYEVVTGKRTIVEAQTLAGDGGERLDDVVFAGQWAAVPADKVGDPFVKTGRLVDSGVEWIGDVPDHWTMGCFSEITKIKTGFPFSMDMASTEKLSETHLPLIKMSNFKFGQNHLNVLDNQSYFDRRIAPNHVLNHGEFIMGLSGSVENVYWHETNEEWLVNQRIAIFYKTNRYSWHLVQCPGFLSSLVDDTAGTAQVNISHLDVCKQKIAIPSISEQQLIGQYLDTATNVIDQEISLLEHKCALLSDKRKALIFEAVTGKIDLRDTTNT